MSGLDICIGIDLEIPRNELPEPGRIPEILGSFDNGLVPCGRERLKISPRVEHGRNSRSDTPAHNSESGWWPREKSPDLAALS